MIASLIEWLLARLGFERHDIGRAGDVYLTRWVLWGQRYGPGGKLFLHRFHRSDSDAALHDHPWGFWSLILWGGYWEHRPAGGGSARRWYGPLSLLMRAAEWRHRVELRPGGGGGTWTLIWTGEKVRSWGFHCEGGFVHWTEFVRREDAGRPGCGGDEPDGAAADVPADAGGGS